MLLSPNRRGASSITAVIGMALMLLLGVGTWFFVSKPFQTRVKEGYREATEWTADNIQRDPIGYLTWALQEVGNTEQKLQASVLAMKTKENGADRAVEKHLADKTEFEKLLMELKQGYREASTQQTWPVKVRSWTLDESALKRKIVECHDKLQNVSSLLDTYRKSKNVIDRKLSELDGKLAEVVKLKNRLSTDLEIAKVNKSVEGIASIGDQLNAIVDTSSALVSAADEGVSVEEMIKPSGDTRVDVEFAKIIAE